MTQIYKIASSPLVHTKYSTEANGRNSQYSNINNMRIDSNHDEYKKQQKIKRN